MKEMAATLRWVEAVGHTEHIHKYRYAYRDSIGTLYLDNQTNNNRRVPIFCIEKCRVADPDPDLFAGSESFPPDPDPMYSKL